MDMEKSDVLEDTTDEEKSPVITHKRGGLAAVNAMISQWMNRSMGALNTGL